MKLLPGADAQLLYDTERLSVLEFSPSVTLPSAAAYVARYKDAPGVRFMDGEFCFGTALIHQTLLHVGVLPEYQGRLFSILPQVLSWCFTVSDPVYALMRPQNKKVLTFAKRFGWMYLPIASSKTIRIEGGPYEIYALTADTPRIPLTTAERRLQRLQRDQRQATMNSKVNSELETSMTA